MLYPFLSPKIFCTFLLTFHSWSPPQNPQRLKDTRRRRQQKHTDGAGKGRPAQAAKQCAGPQRTGGQPGKIPHSQRHPPSSSASGSTHGRILKKGDSSSRFRAFPCSLVNPRLYAACLPNGRFHPKRTGLSARSPASNRFNPICRPFQSG